MPNALINDLFGEITQVRGDDYIGPPTNRRCQHMAIIWIGKL